MITRIPALLARAALSRDPELRYAARFELVGGVARRLGFQIYNRNLAWLDDPEYREAIGGFRSADRYVKDRKYVLYSMARALRDLPGDSAECGVFDGGSSFLMCLAREGGAGGLHHVFDSFEGLSSPGSLDQPEDPTAYRWREHDLAVPLETVKRNLARFDFVRYHEGWIPSRFESVADRRFRLVHVDVDLYQPTRDAVSFFYERLVPGGILLCDDYGSTLCPGARRAFDEFVANKPEGRVVHLTTGQGFIVRRAGDGAPAP